jgi:hypothetical protein
MHSNFVNDPTCPEFYPRRIYDRASNFCIVNNAASPAYQRWDPATGLSGLMDQIRDWHQPCGDGTDQQIQEVAEAMTRRACEFGHLSQEGETFVKLT